ncbi:MAG: hypothetical protein LC792_18420 [Actinobacteria bacterium]|nr:hypothetical protein [Actinomycetota bacterium]
MSDQGEPITLDEFLPSFHASHSLLDDLQALGDAVELVEWALRQGEFVKLGSIEAGRRTYVIRVNGREHEAPHVDVRCGPSIHVRIFLGSTPEDVLPDNAPNRLGTPGFEQQIRNRKARELILAYVRAHHACWLEAWHDQGNPMNKGMEMSVTCQEHRQPPAALLGRGPIRYGSLHAHLDP